jgi:preprotein translocase subunit SecG
MESILILVAVFVVVIAVLVAVVMRSRRGKSSIGRGSGDTVYERRRKELQKDPWIGPPPF